MKNNILICFVNMNQFEGNFDDLSDEEVLRLANDNNGVYTLKFFEIRFNYSEKFLRDFCSTNFVRIIELEDN